MVFGFGKKKAVEVPPSATAEKEVPLQEIPSIIKGLEAPLLSRIVQGARQLRKEMEANQNGIHDVILDLESDDLKLDDVDKNLRTIGKRGKDAVVATVKKETRNGLASIEKYEDVLELNEQVNQILKRMGDILGLHTRVMHVFARKYADRMKDEIAKLAQNRNSLQRMISEQENFKSDSNHILETVTKIREIGMEREKKVRRSNEVIDEKAETTKAAARLESEISSMRSSPEYGQFLGIKKEMGLLSNEGSEIKTKVDAQFSKISRPLNKYSYVSSFDKPIKKIMEELIDNPYGVLSAENRDSIIEILQAANKSVMAGNVSVKDSDRSAELIEETIEMLDGFLKLKAEHVKKISDLESKLGVFDVNRLEEKERELEKARQNIADLEAAHQRLEKEIVESKVQADAATTELEESLSRLSKSKVVVRIGG